MSKQDFAQVKADSQPESKSGSGSILSAIGILVIAGLCFSGGYWLGAGDVHRTGNKTDTDALDARLATQVAQNRLLQAKNETLQDMVAQWKSKAEQGAHTKVGELTFYKELPKQSVTPAPVPDAPKAAPHVSPQRAKKSAEVQQVAAAADAAITPAASIAAVAQTQKSQHSNAGFRIQLASFRTKSDAMIMQRKLAQAGFVSQIERADLGEKGQWFRLYTGLYHSRSSAEKAQQKIDMQMKLKGLIIRDK